MQIQGSRKLMALMWPPFLQIGDCIFLASELPPNGLDLASFRSLTAAESFVNHLHVLDFFEHSAKRADYPYWAHDHPDFHAACELGMQISQMWAAKLQRDFPKQSFRVYYAAKDNPTVRFHAVHADEAPWASQCDYQAQLNSGELLILQVEGGRNTV